MAFRKNPKPAHYEPAPQPATIISQPIVQPQAPVIYASSQPILYTPAPQGYYPATGSVAPTVVASEPEFVATERALPNLGAMMTKINPFDKEDKSQAQAQAQTQAQSKPVSQPQKEEKSGFAQTMSKLNPFDKESKDEKKKDEGGSSGNGAKEQDSGNGTGGGAGDAAAGDDSLFQPLVSYEIPSGSFVIQVHIIEARGLQGRDVSGTSDPICIVQAFDETQATPQKKKTNSCVWDHVLFFEKDNAVPEDIECGKVLISIFDANTFSRKELIGSFEFGMGYVYHQKNHEIWRMWVPLSDPTGKFEGTQGYVKVSVTVLGPGDEQVIHTDEELRERDKKEIVMMTPKIKQEGHLLTLEIHIAENLPKVDTGGTCDAFITAKFSSGASASTKYIEKSTSPVIGQAIELPVMHPNMSEIIELSLFDHERVGSDRLLATTFLRYSDILKASEKGIPNPKWFNFYGPPIGENNDAAGKMKSGKMEGSVYYGRVMVLAYDTKNPTPKIKVRKIPSIKTVSAVASAPHKIRLDLYETADLPLDGEEIQVVVQWFDKEFKSSKVKVKDGRAGFFMNFPDIEMKAPQDKISIPDVFIYVEKHELIGSPKRVAYIRVPFRDISPKGGLPKWVTFKEDKAYDAFSKFKFPGSLLFRLTGGPSNEIDSTPRIPCVQYPPEKYILRCNLYQGRDLIAMDDDGFSDPYVELKFGSSKAKTSVRNKTLNPIWNEFKDLSVSLPKETSYAANLQVIVYDKDKVNDDLLGRFQVSMSSIISQSTKTPTWYDLSLEDTSIPLGQILASFELVPEGQKSLLSNESIAPPTKPYKVEVTVVGLRNLQPIGLMPILKPCIEFDVGDRAKKGRFKTERSCRPSRRNPNYMKTFTMHVDMPTQKVFAPSLTVRVMDDRGLGLFNSVLASGSIKLDAYVQYDSQGVILQESELPEATANPSAAQVAEPNKSRSAAFLPLKTDGADGNITGEQTTSAEASGVGEPNTSLSASEDVLSRKPQVERKKPRVPPVKLPDFDLSKLRVIIPSRVFGERKQSGGASLGGTDDGHGDGHEEDAPLLQGSSTSKSASCLCTKPRFNLCSNETDEEEMDEIRQPADIPYIDSKFEKKDFIPEYMKERRVIDNELEDVFKSSPFEEFPLFRGVALEDDNPFSFITDNDYLGHMNSDIFADDSRPVGKLKGFIRTYPAYLPAPPPVVDMQKYLVPQKYIVRVYILRAHNLTPEDDDGMNDPYVVLELDKKKIKDDDNRKSNTNDPEFYKCYEIEASLPGASVLKISLFDYDGFSDDDLIGSTKIDLETRIFNPEWLDLPKKPVEFRTLTSRHSSVSHGKLEMWLDIIPKSDIKKFPIIDISPPAKKDFELRVIIWKTRYVESEDSITNQNDMYVTGEFCESDQQKTDIHLRAKKGYGSFNYRMIFPVKLPMKNPRLRLSVWDFDIFKPNDIIGQAELDLSDLMDATFYNKVAVSLLPEPMWLDIYHPSKETSRGQVQVSIQILPKAMAELAPAGRGRESPNLNPVLNPPERIKFNPLRPDLMLMELLGPELYGKLMKPLLILFVIAVSLIFLYILFQLLTVIGVLT